MDGYEELEQAKARFGEGQSAAKSGQDQEAFEAFGDAASRVHALWSDTEQPHELRVIAARLAADAQYSSAMASLRLPGATGKVLQDATVRCIAIYEDDALPGDVRLHGLYRAQCAAFELGHVWRHSSPAEAAKLFKNAIDCTDAMQPLVNTDKKKVARVLANGGAAAYTLSQLVKDRGDKSYRDELERASALGHAAVRSEELPPAMHAETLLVLMEVAYELALAEEEKDDALGGLQDALGWAREAAEAPGADALTQAQAMLRGANIAVVYGLHLRTDDYELGLSALQGAVDLAMSAANEEALPTDLRANGYSVAIRTQQNIALLAKENHAKTASKAFVAAAELAEEALALPGLPSGAVGEFAYLGANAIFEAGVIDLRLNQDRNTARARFAEVLRRCKTTLDASGTDSDVRARAALLSCGALGRTLHTLGRGDDQAINDALQAIVEAGRIAAEEAGADSEARERGAFYAADSARKLAERIPGASAHWLAIAQELEDLRASFRLELPKGGIA